MTDEKPHHDPLTDEERAALVEEALATATGRAIQGTYLETIALSRWFDMDPHDLIEARREAPDEGMETSQRALDAMPDEERDELTLRAINMFRKHCEEAVYQLETLTLGLWEDPHEIDADLVATVAGLPIIASGDRRREPGA